MYKRKLRKYITNCNGESEPLAARGLRSSRKWRLFGSRKQPSAFIMLHCYKEIAFLYKWNHGRGRAERRDPMSFILISKCGNMDNWTDCFRKEAIRLFRLDSLLESDFRNIDSQARKLPLPRVTQISSGAVHNPSLQSAIFLVVISFIGVIN